MTRVSVAAPDRAALIQQLRKVTEPCSIAVRNPVDIVHLGPLRQFITDILLELPGVQSVEVRQTSATLWTPDRVGRELPGR